MRIFLTECRVVNTSNIQYICAAGRFSVGAGWCFTLKRFIMRELFFFLPMNLPLPDSDTVANV